MTDLPIIFSAPMVRVLLDGRKTQTRRLASSPLAKAKPGDRLWVRETIRLPDVERDGIAFPQPQYAADGAHVMDERGKASNHAFLPRRAVPSIHMPRWASRLTLVVTEVRFERLQDISEDDARAEGVEDPMAEREDRDWSICAVCGGTGLHGALGEHLGYMEVDCADCNTHRKRFRHLWSHLHGAGSWDENPELVALTFEVHQRNIDQMPCGECAGNRKVIRVIDGAPEPVACPTCTKAGEVAA